jgi:hypothetical protein
MEFGLIQQLLDGIFKRDPLLARVFVYLRIRRWYYIETGKKLWLVPRLSAA